MKMKYLLMAFASVTLFSSCISDEPSEVIAEYKTPTEFVLNKPQFANGVYDLANAGTVNFTFSQPDYGYSAVCDYTVEVAMNDKFENSALVSETYHVCDIQVDANSLAMAICTAAGWSDQASIDAALAETTSGTVPVYVRINSKISNALVTGSEITSNAITINAIPYFALPPVEMPEKMYMIGEFCNWDWANSAEMVPVHSNPGKFWCVRYVDGGTGDGKGFKFNSAQSWNGTDFGFAATTCVTTVAGLEFADNGGNISISKSGWYIFGIDIELVGRDFKYTLNVFPANIYIYGAANGGNWGDDPAWLFEVPTTPDGEFVSPALLETAGTDDSCLRMCIHPLNADESPWAGDWWHTEFIVLGKKIAYRGAGGDQARIGNGADQKVHLNFATGVGEIK